MCSSGGGSSRCSARSAIGARHVMMMVVAENVLLLVAGLLAGALSCGARDCAGGRGARRQAAVHEWQRASVVRCARHRVVVLGCRDESGDADAAARVASIGVIWMRMSLPVGRVDPGARSVAARRGALAAVARPAAQRRSAARRTCRSAGRRPRTSPGSWQCRSGPARRRSSGAITSSSTSAKDRRSRALGRRSNERDRSMEAAARRRQPPDDEAEHVVAVAGDRRHNRSG